MIENGYGICFNDWLFDKEIKNELRLLIAISSLSAKLGYCTASNEYLSGLFGEHNKTISERIGKLEKLNYIKCEYGKLGGAVLWRKIYVTRLQQMTTRKKSNDYPRVAKRLPANNEMTTRNNNSISNNIKDKTMVLSYIGEKEKKIFVKPTFEQVKEEFERRGFNGTVMAEKFIDHYENKEWKIGTAKMKDWKRAVTTWVHSADNERFKLKSKKHDDYLAMLGKYDDIL